MEQTITALQTLGLTQYEAKIYLALLFDNPANGNRISKSAHVPSAKVYENLSRLQDMGLVTTLLETKEYIPLPLEDFLASRKTYFNEASDLIRQNVQDHMQNVQSEILWQEHGYPNLIRRVLSFIDTAQQSIIMSASFNELNEVYPVIQEAIEREVQVDVMVYGTSSACYHFLKKTGANTDFLHLFPHADIPVLYRVHSNEANFVIDESKALVMKGTKATNWSGVWTSNMAMVRMVQSYIKHDIFINKVHHEHGELMQQFYGENYENLLDIDQGYITLDSNTKRK